MVLHKFSTFSLILLQPLGIALVARCLLEVSAVASACVVALSFFAVCDGWYFMRILWWVLWETSRDYFHDHADREGLFATSVLPGRVLVTDIDRNAHCNNARYLRECGFGRRDLWHRNGLWKVIKLTGGNLIVGAQTVRFRREMTLGQRYVLTSRVLCWDSRAFYIEHRFVTQTNNEEPFVNAIVMVKSTVLGKLSPAKLVEMLPGLHPTEETNRPVTEDLLKWIESNEISSKMLRK